MTGLRGPVVVTGTDTGVGKTIATAAIAAAAGRAGVRVAVLKPAQTGIPGAPLEKEESSDVAGRGFVESRDVAGRGFVESRDVVGRDVVESDVDVVVRLAGPASAATMASYPDPLAPAAAARVSGLPALELFAVVDRARELQRAHDLVLIEGAGGLLVPMGWTSAAHAAQGRGAEWNVADLATVLGAPMVLVTRAGLGTLNHTALTIEALERREIRRHVVVGSWPAEPELVHRTNLEDLAVTLDGVLPQGAGCLTPEAFRAAASSWLSAILYGTGPARS